MHWITTYVNGTKNNFSSHPKKLGPTLMSQPNIWKKMGHTWMRQNKHPKRWNMVEHFCVVKNSGTRWDRCVSHHTRWDCSRLDKKVFLPFDFYQLSPGNSGVSVTLYEQRRANISKLERSWAPQPLDIAKAVGVNAAEAILQVTDRYLKYMYLVND